MCFISTLHISPKPQPTKAEPKILSCLNKHLTYYLEILHLKSIEKYFHTGDIIW